VYGVTDSPLSQPKNLLGGHLISGIVGVACYFLLGTGWPAAALAVSVAIIAMIFTDTVHPPGGATALIAVIGGEQVHSAGFWYVLAPAGLGALVLLVIALLVNNLDRDRRYPEHWF
jgi:CBS-domain-containing membrane protein